MALCGIDLGGTKCLGVVLDDGEIVAETRAPTPRGTDALVATLVGVVAELGTEVTVEAVGVGAPGLVDRRGALHVAPHLAVEPGLHLRSVLEGALGLPVVVENDATCAARGERERGSAIGFDDVILVTLGTGIGGGIIVDGEIRRGANGFAGEFGHMVVDPDGPPCPCGRRGCWERYSSGSSLAALGREVAGGTPGSTKMVELAGGRVTDVRGEHVVAALADGDPQAEEAMRRFAWWTGLGLANLANIFDPQVFVLGGGLVGAGEALLAPVRRAFVEHLFGAENRPAIAVVGAALGERAGAVGAAGIAGHVR